MQSSQKCHLEIFLVFDLLPAPSGISLIELHKNLGLLEEEEEEEEEDSELAAVAL